MDQQVIGGYKILKPIGAGGMAKVYLAVHEDVPNLQVILKVLTDSRLVERFKQEADKLALLDGNPNICRIKHFFHHGDNIVIAMEYIDGITLDDRIKDDGKVETGETLKIVLDVLGVIEFAHQKGIYHRDIKPSNIMIDKHGTVKVIDFGIAKAESDPNLTQAGSACGTPAYMAPEQFTPSEDTNYAAIDIYAVGVTLYRALTGELPFKGDNEFAIRDAKLFTDPPRARELNPQIDRKLDDLIMRCLKKDPANRFSTASELIAALHAVSPKMAASETPTRTISQTPQKKFPIKIVAGAAGVVAAAVIGYFVLTSGGENIPLSPQLTQPTDGSTLEVPSPTLSWTGVTKDDETYTLEYANNPDFFISEIVTDLTTASHAIGEGLESDSYWWRVQTVNSEGDSSGYGPPFTFTVELPTPLTPQGTIEIAVDPDGDIYLGDELIAQNSSGTSVTVDTGTYSVRVRNNRATRKEMNREVYVATDTNITLNYRFNFPAATKPAEPKPAPTLGEVKVGSKPINGADIYIDGELQDRKTPSAFQVTPGRHVIRGILNFDGALRIRIDTVSVIAGDSHRIILDFDK